MNMWIYTVFQKQLRVIDFNIVFMKNTFGKRYEKAVIFFETYNKYPLIESLTKMGFKNIVEMKINKISFKGTINWRAKTVFKLQNLIEERLERFRKKENINRWDTSKKYYKKIKE